MSQGTVPPERSHPLTRLFRGTVEALTPLHVGDGRGPLMHDVDFAIDRGTIYLIDPARLWRHLDEVGLAEWAESVFRLSSFLKPADYPRLAAASFPIVGHLEAAGGLLNQLVDARGRPYLPGSSLKGALRSALLQVTDVPLDLAGAMRESRSRNWLARPIERRAFGPNPNRDLWRALRVSDSAPTEPARLRAAVVGIYSLRGSRLVAKGISHRLNVVTLSPGTRLGFEIGLDEFALEQGRLGGAVEKDRLRDLARSCQAASRQLIAEERRFYAEAGPPGPARFYRDLLARTDTLEASRFFLPIGWGTGWLSKTIGPALREDPEFPELRQGFCLGYPEAPFPKSRRLVESTPDLADAPLGWAQITLEESADARP